MSDRDVEIEVASFSGREVGASNALLLEAGDAIAYRDRGNLPDDMGRSLRLVLFIDGVEPVSVKRLRFEPDYQDPPRWRREGSRSVNVLPLRIGEKSASATPWWEDPEVAPLEEEWRRSGNVAGMAVPSEYRGFVYKTVLEFRETGREITADSVSDSIARWVPHADVETLRAALKEAQPPGRVDGPE